MNDEQRRIAYFHTQPKGLRLFLHPASLSIAQVEWLHHALSASLDTKTVTSSGEYERETDPHVSFDRGKYVIKFSRYNAALFILENILCAQVDVNQTSSVRSQSQEILPAMRKVLY